VPAGLVAHAVARVDQQDGGIGGRRAGGHVARVLLVSRRIREDEFAPRGREVAIRHVDGDALLAFRLQPVGEQREIDRARCSRRRRRFHRSDLIFVHPA
jgi:hypothetical protein